MAKPDRNAKAGTGLSHRPLPDLGPERLAELAHRYWYTDETRKSIVAHFDLHEFEFSRLLPRLPADQPCRHCGRTMRWRSRQARHRGHAACLACGHRTTPTCGCDGCRRATEAELRRREIDEAEHRSAVLRDWHDSLQPGDVAGIVKDLSTPKRIYLDGLCRHWADRVDWTDIAETVGIQARWVDNYLRRFQALGLLFFDGQRWHLHEEIHSGRAKLLP